ncbi:MAG: ATP-binding protein [Polyangiaceae bacterium]|nr:ATP-binding protein [Polyangiaceae bacterium]
MGTPRSSPVPAFVTRATTGDETATWAPERASGFARGCVTEGELCFLGSLHELVAIGLYRPSLDALVSGAGPVARPPMDRAYLLKVLEEETSRQFAHPLRPVVELVLNAVDASTERPARVDVRIGSGLVTVSDTGVGMDLCAILSRLLIPFATDKRAGIDLGRFGVGFFSVIGLGLPDPRSLSIEIETGDGKSGFALCVRADGPEVSSLVCSIRRVAPMQGTCARLRSALLEPESLRAYLRDTLHFFPADRSLIEVDGMPINDGRFLVGGKQFADSIGGDGGPHVARYHVGGRGLAMGIGAATYHAGVKVEGCLAIPELSLIDFPAAVELTEGRDALKPCRTFHATAARFYRRLAELGSASETPRKTADRLAELAAQISALMLRSTAWTEVAPELARRLLGPNRYLVSVERRELLVGFLGSTIEERLFVPESFWAEREWQGFVPGERELLEKELEMTPVESLASVVWRRPDLVGLCALAARVERSEQVLVTLARGRRLPPGPLPCIGVRQTIVVREDSPAVTGLSGWTETYALRVAFERACGTREPDLEREIIVNEPLLTRGVI